MTAIATGMGSHIKKERWKQRQKKSVASYEKTAHCAVRYKIFLSFSQRMFAGRLSPTEIRTSAGVSSGERSSSPHCAVDATKDPGKRRATPFAACSLPHEEQLRKQSCRSATCLADGSGGHGQRSGLIPRRVLPSTKRCSLSHGAAIVCGCSPNRQGGRTSRSCTLSGYARQYQHQAEVGAR